MLPLAARIREEKKFSFMEKQLHFLKSLYHLTEMKLYKTA